MRLFSTTVGLLVLGGLLGAPGRLPAAGTELTRLHILMVFDTNAKELANSLHLDQERLVELWEDTIPSDRYKLTILRGKEVNKAAILQYYRRLQVTRGEGLVFYYGGHGATDKRTGEHFFELSTRTPLYRREVVAAMEAKKAELVVVLSDCCSTPKLLKGQGSITKRSLPAQTIHPTVRSLLFTARGTVDVTAATDNASWGDNQDGGLFTRSLSSGMRKPVAELDTDRDGTVSWDEFFPRLQKDTKKMFEDWRKKMIARGEDIDSRSQVPHAFKRRLAVVGIENATTKALEYQVRWPGEEWTEVSLKPGERQVHRLVLSGREQGVPTLEAKFRGVKKAQQLPAADWTGLGEPGEPEKTYRIRPRQK